jgi:hypothetical protein
MSGAPTAAVDLVTLILTVQGFCKQHFPGVAVEWIDLGGPGLDRPLHLPIPATAPVVPRPAPGPLTERQEDIVQVLRENDGEKSLIAKQIATKAGYELNTAFREDLAELARRKVITSLNPGYVLPDAS